MDNRLIMALLYLLSVFNQYFKITLAVSSFAGNPQAFTLCLLCKKNRHPVPAIGTRYLRKFLPVYFLQMIHHLLQDPCQISAVFQGFEYGSFILLFFF